jgi:hypothetical protein
MFLRWRKINMTPRLSSPASMSTLIRFYIILFPLRTRHHRQIPIVPSMNSRPPLNLFHNFH